MSFEQLEFEVVFDTQKNMWEFYYPTYNDEIEDFEDTITAFITVSSGFNFKMIDCSIIDSNFVQQNNQADEEGIYTQFLDVSDVFPKPLIKIES